MAAGLVTLTDPSLSDSIRVDTNKTRTKRSPRSRLLAQLGRISSTPSLLRIPRIPALQRSRKPSASCNSLQLPYNHNNSGSHASQIFDPDDTCDSPKISSRLLTSSPSDVSDKFGSSQSLSFSNVSLKARTYVNDSCKIHEFAYRMSPEHPLQSPRTWNDLPLELHIHILSYLTVKDLLLSSGVSRAWRELCFNGQLWKVLNIRDLPRNISLETFNKLIVSAGPYIRRLDMRGCRNLQNICLVQWPISTCKNLESISIDSDSNGIADIEVIDSSSFIQDMSITTRSFVDVSPRRGIANHRQNFQNFQNFQKLNEAVAVSLDDCLCSLERIILSCVKLKELQLTDANTFIVSNSFRAIFLTNRLEKLSFRDCTAVKDVYLRMLVQGNGSNSLIRNTLAHQFPIPTRKLKHLDLTNCKGITDEGLKSCVDNLPYLEFLKLAKCTAITDVSLIKLVQSTPKLTHIDLEDVTQITDNVLIALSESQCCETLRTLCVSFCDNIGDVGMMPIFRRCMALESVSMDNTSISDFTLIEAASMVGKRSERSTYTSECFKPSLHLEIYDCPHVTWTAIKEILSRNAEVQLIPRLDNLLIASLDIQSTTLFSQICRFKNSDQVIDKWTSTQALPIPPILRREQLSFVRTYSKELITMKCYHHYQPTVTQHTARLLKHDVIGAHRLERIWTSYMLASEEAATSGPGSRRRRRRARLAQTNHAVEASQITVSDIPFSGGRIEAVPVTLFDTHAVGSPLIGPTEVYAYPQGLNNGEIRSERRHLMDREAEPSNLNALTSGSRTLSTPKNGVCVVM